jgi:hypothetical protein
VYFLPNNQEEELSMMRTASLGTLRIVVSMLGGILASAGVLAQPPAVSAPSPADSREYLVAPSIPYGSRISRVMRLLATSTPEHKHRVRILFYGQSITGGWTDIVLKDLQARFPHADIIAENHAIGGFSAPWLSQTAEADLYPWYPYLLFIQDYGALDPAMERMYTAIRNRTTAEVLAFTHHLDAGSKADQEKNTGESAKIREMADKFGYEVVDIRPSWQKYVELHHMDRKELLSDSVHLKPNGIALMASMVVPHLRYDPQRQPAGPDRVRYYDAEGRLLKGPFDDAQSVALTRALRFEFDGNRVDIATVANGNFGTAKILVDGKKPSAFREMYATTRANSAPGSWFPAIRCFELGEGVVPENWELTITRIDDKCSEFEYEVKGSLTGPDGKGNSKEKFTSNSGRLTIQPQTSCFEAAHQIFKKPVPIGFKVVWSVYGTFLDEWKPRRIADPAKENLYTLAQGLPNGKHVLEITPNGDGDLPVRYLVVYQPMPPTGW